MYSWNDTVWYQTGNETANGFCSKSTCDLGHEFLEFRVLSENIRIFHHGFSKKLRININKSALLYSFILRVLFFGVEQRLEVVCWFQLVIK